MACGLWGNPSPEWYAALAAERRRWLAHYLAKGCSPRKAEEMVWRRMARR